MSYKDDGYVIIKTGLEPKIRILRDKFISVFNEIAGPITNDDEIIKLYKSDRRNLWVAAYDQLRYLPAVYEICNDLVKSAMEETGVKLPALAINPVVRADMPFDSEFDFETIQDYTYNQGSLNSITIWLPFQDCRVEAGSPKVVPGTHRKGQLETLDNRTLARNFADDEFSHLSFSVGDALVFSQFLVHRHSLNFHNNVRFSLQIRVNDLSAKDYKRRGYYLNTVRHQKSFKIDFKTAEE